MALSAEVDNTFARKAAWLEKVHPQQQVTEGGILSIPDDSDVPVDEAFLNKSLSNSSQKSYYQRGQCVHPESVPEASFMTTMVEFAHEVIPQTNSVPPTTEQVNWVRIQKFNYDVGGHKVGHVIIIGLARGYQIWAHLENGDCEEIISERSGPLRAGIVLPFQPEPIHSICENKYKESRPIFAFVDSNAIAYDAQFNELTFMSLKSGVIVNKLDCTGSIIDLKCSSKCLVVCLVDRLIICDVMTLSIIHVISKCRVADTLLAPPFALSDRLLAYADVKFDRANQSVGGATFDCELSYTSQVMNAAKCLTKLGETMVQSLTFSSNAKAPHEDYGFVTVVDIDRIDKIEHQNRSEYVLHHFIAHDTPVGHLSFGQGGNLLLTTGQDATSFHLFQLLSHPGSPSLGAVQHLYTLFRGNTPAKVLDTTFSDDNRWLAIATNHGTVHVFPITPYGGAVNVRTHGGSFVNKESRFERSAGITSSDFVASPRNQSNTPPARPSPNVPNPIREHPVIGTTTLVRSVVNPRVGPFPQPLVVNALAKIRQHISTENITARASDMTPTAFTGKQPSRSASSLKLAAEMSRRLAVSFVAPSLATAAPNSAVHSHRRQTLLVMSNDGMLMEYQLQPQRERTSSTSSTSERTSSTSSTSSAHAVEGVPAQPQSLPSGPSSQSLSKQAASRQSQNGQIRLKPFPLAQWELKRTKNSSDVHPPLSVHSPLVSWTKNSSVSTVPITVDSDDEEPKKVLQDKDWLPQVEVTTYCGPHRRLWMGPQFAFSYYAPSGHSSADLVSPSESPNSSNSANLHRSVPVVIGDSSVAAGSFENPAARIVCGSWQSDFDSRLSGGDETTVRDQIADAMNALDMNEKSPPAGRPHFVTGDSDSLNSSQDLVVFQD
uniref:BCAS3 domain-containing protein n=1 Tax=Steinernema glaseri TaxID=37863 RepID=A0A1I7Z3T0_9BILA